MLTIDSLRAFGADVDDGLRRCMNNEGFYLKLVQSVFNDDHIPKLEAAINTKDLNSAFEIAHALKGMYGNLSLTPLLKPVSEMTELLRSRTDTDYSSLLNELKQQMAKLSAL